MSIYDNRDKLSECLACIDSKSYTGDTDLGGLDDLLESLKLLIISATIEAVTAQACGSERKPDKTGRIRQ